MAITARRHVLAERGEIVALAWRRRRRGGRKGVRSSTKYVAVEAVEAFGTWKRDQTPTKVFTHPNTRPRANSVSIEFLPKIQYLPNSPEDEYW